MQGGTCLRFADLCDAWDWVNLVKPCKRSRSFAPVGAQDDRRARSVGVREKKKDALKGVDSHRACPHCQDALSSINRARPAIELQRTPIGRAGVPIDVASISI